MSCSSRQENYSEHNIRQVLTHTLALGVWGNDKCKNKVREQQKSSFTGHQGTSAKVNNHHQGSSKVASTEITVLRLKHGSLEKVSTQKLRSWWGQQHCYLLVFQKSACRQIQLRNCEMFFRTGMFSFSWDNAMSRSFFLT